MGPDEPHDGLLPGEAREVALPILSDPALPAQRIRATVAFPAPERARVPVVQAAAVAATSFVAGAAVAGLVRRSRSRGPAPAVGGGRTARTLTRRRRGGGAATAPQILEIVSSRSLLVDVHLLGLPGPSER